MGLHCYVPDTGLITPKMNAKGLEVQVDHIISLGAWNDVISIYTSVVAPASCSVEVLSSRFEPESFTLCTGVPSDEPHLPGHMQWSSSYSHCLM
jgi:hypothetical protein